MNDIRESFDYKHLPEQTYSTLANGFHNLAEDIATRLPHNPERIVALRRLLEAYGAVIRAMAYK